MRGLLLAALVEVGLITWRDLSSDKILPIPSDYVAIAIFYGGLAMFPASAGAFPAAVGWGMVLATYMGFFDPTNPTKLIFPGGSANPNVPPGGTAPSASSKNQGQLNPAGTPLGGQNALAPTYTGTNFS